ncbi:Polynucleotide adenylyltransferase region [Clostridium sp. DL-VIII]|uniref:CCA tRNA nucleotidyltransferase n=1 Tax=Clostridium sp. DL-VIII TaxID=641107 RepID=UPI00023AFAB3|nr:HD domain-containing protein [Clostridium sp. DL-VIII]EHJ00068.1 Polynucleotide adenylyltransferase region [Clostridium sp. DL-VIII]
MNVKIKLPQDVEFITSRLIDNGYEAYAVGGCVRDSILSKKPKDWDITTKAKPDDVIRLFDRVVLTGLKHGTVTIILNNENYEVTTYRNDGEYEDNRHPKQVKFVSSLKEDLARRDFTINAMAYNEINGLIDYFGGIQDLNDKIIKTVGDPKQRFGEDALRMLRAIRFSAELNFRIDSAIITAIKELKDNIKYISKERIREEFNKILINDSRKIEILKECELLDYIIPGINRTYDFDQNNPYHVYDLYTHTLLSLEAIDSVLHLKLTMLLHDFGKLFTKTTDKNGISHYYSHGKESVIAAKNILKDLKYDNDTINLVLTLIQYHDCILESKASIKRMLNKIGEDLFRDLIKVKRADILSQNPLYIKEGLLNLIKVEEKLDLIIKQRECFNLKDLKINGKDLIYLGFNKGKEIGEILKYLLDLVIENPNLNDEEKLIELANKKIKSKS